jgi:uncharacterized protein (DUF58 family)
VSGRAPGSPFDPAAIPAVVRARLRSLRLRTRLEARGAGIGQHAGRSRGAGLEFAQYRAYGDGDEPRRVDWKLYARSDRYFVRDALRDDPLTVWLLLDASASMEQADRLRPHYRKIDAARELAACVAEIALQLGDAFGLAGLSDAGLQLLPPGAGRRQRDRLWLELHALRCGGAVPPEAALRPLWGRIEAGALVLLISDDFDETLLEYVERLAGAGREVVSIGVLSAEERDFPFSGGHRFREPESGAEVHLEARGAEDEFLPRFRAARNALARRLAAGGIRHVDYVIDQPLDAPLQHLFRAGAGESQG